MASDVPVRVAAPLKGQRGAAGAPVTLRYEAVKSHVSVVYKTDHNMCL